MSGGTTEAAHVWIEAGRVAAGGLSLSPGTRVLDATGALVSPGYHRAVYGGTHGWSRTPVPAPRCHPGRKLGGYGPDR